MSQFIIARRGKSVYRGNKASEAPAANFHAGTYGPISRIVGIYQEPQRSAGLLSSISPIVLDGDGLRLHLESQQVAGIDAVLVAGTMGAIQLLSGGTYAELLRQRVEYWGSSGELFVGIGETSFARTMERLRVANELKIDGAVVLSPFFLRFSQSEVIDYFHAIAQEARAPIYFYDLPQRNGVALEVETVMRLAVRANIAGIKCAGDISHIRRLADVLRGGDFRILVAQATIIDILLRAGLRAHLDGIYCLAPNLVRKIRISADSQDWGRATKYTTQLNNLLNVILRYGVFPAMTALLNWRGVPGNFAPPPHRQLSEPMRAQLLAEPAVHAAFAV
jgi:dihydrodipicolinate synthase/N-acetylneuraminate lyase